MGFNSNSIIVRFPVNSIPKYIFLFLFVVIRILGTELRLNCVPRHDSEFRSLELTESQTNAKQFTNLCSRCDDDNG